MTQVFPLHWPTGHLRTFAAQRKKSKFNRSLAGARDDLLDQIHKLGGTQIVISSNAKLRTDGLPYSKQPSTDDPGVAVYFIYQKQQVVFACDKWSEIGANIRALGLAIEAIRGLERWGVSQMLKQAFAGFKVLSDPTSQDKMWYHVLGIQESASWDDIRKAYLKLAQELHPDKSTGSQEGFQRLQNAYDEAKRLRRTN